MTSDDLYRVGTAAVLVAIVAGLSLVERLTRRAAPEDPGAVVADCPRCRRPLTSDVRAGAALRAQGYGS